MSDDSIVKRSSSVFLVAITIAIAVSFVLLTLGQNSISFSVYWAAPAVNYEGLFNAILSTLIQSARRCISIFNVGRYRKLV
jgi:hypothetical protein